VNGLNMVEADRLEVISLVDNYTDVLMESTEIAQRPPLIPPLAPLAEHGLSILLKVFSGAEEHHVLFDTGQSPICLTNNLDLLKLDAQKIECIVISHGHVDHVMGLIAALSRARPNIPVIAHPDIFAERRHRSPDGHTFNIPALNEADLREKGVNVLIMEKPSVIASGLVLLTNRVERVTEFEKGFPSVDAKIDGQWIVDPFNDDQALAVKVKGKGLVVIAGCSHAGIINTVRYCCKLAGTEKVHAVLGGFHLNDKIFDPIIGPTITEMKKIKPDYIVPMHCTGWNAMVEFSREMPKQFILNSAATTYLF
jgi:7,8-dihydropterin-6-yl-methyl-4-(beta-D-ribofuranosyl)aminobenzene 5'-phosphate synthase